LALALGIAAFPLAILAIAVAASLGDGPAADIVGWSGLAVALTAAVVAIVLGHRSRGAKARAAGLTRGRAKATAGLSLGYAWGGFVLFVLLVGAVASALTTGLGSGERTLLDHERSIAAGDALDDSFILHYDAQVNVSVDAADGQPIASGLYRAVGQDPRPVGTASWGERFGSSTRARVTLAKGTYTLRMACVSTEACLVHFRIGVSDPGPLTRVSSSTNHATADFGSSATGGCVAFVDRATNGVLWLWDFGDGGTSTQPSPTHRYTAPGTYHVRLTVTGPSRSSSTSFSDVTVASAEGCGTLDRDGDGVADVHDDCPGAADHGQADLDRDGLGDACDADRDGDGVPNPVDDCPDQPDVDQDCQAT